MSLIGRVGSDPDIRYTQGQDPMCVARYRLAVDRGDRNRTTDWITCVAFGKMGEFAEKYIHKGMKIGVTGRIQTGSYKNRDGQTVYTFDVNVLGHHFCESKNGVHIDSSNVKQDSERNVTKRDSNGYNYYGQGTVDGFMSMPDGIDEELPFT